ncbi:MAG: PKD domain-containing protein [Chthoniobacterales bacterium]
MRKYLCPSSGFLIPRLALASGLLLAAGFLAFFSFAATPPSGTLDAAHPKLTYMTGPNVQSNPSGFAGTLVCNAAAPCDDYKLTVDASGFVGTHNIVITVVWPNNVEDYDVYVHQGQMPPGPVIKTAASSADPEIAIIDAVSGLYTIRVVPFAVAGGTFTATIEFVKKPSSIVPDPPGPGTPRYHNFAAPEGMGNSAGEPTLGAGISTQPNGGRTMYIAGLETLRVTWNDCSSPASAPAFPGTPAAFNPLWEDKSFITESVVTLDPILHTDVGAGRLSPGRTFVSQLGPKTSFLAYSDDDGESYIQSQGSGINSGVDHQNIGAGPYNEDASPPPPPHPLYENAVYYASQDAAVAQMARSDDGGQTFGPAIPMYNLTQCGGLHGHTKVAPDGTVYLPNKGCGTGQGVVVSEDNGLTFQIRTVPGSSPGDTDPSIGIDAAGKIYFAFADGDGRAKVAVSSNKGVNWSVPVDVGLPFGIKNTVFPGAVGGSAGRATVMYLATDTPGGYEATGVFKGVWHIYAAHTFDGGDSWTTVRVSPENDPVQVGSICTGGVSCGEDRNLLDFNDVEIDHEGRVIIAYADGCVGCTSPTGADSRSAKATIARQSGGKRMLAAFGPEDSEPNPPAAPRVESVTREGDSLVRLRWSAPDNGGAPLTGYNVYRKKGAAGAYVVLGAGTPTVTADKTTYDDNTATTGMQYFYKVTALNTAEGPNCGEFEVGEPIDLGDPCILPGLRKLGPDPGTGGTAPGPAGPGMNLQTMQLAQPFVPGANPEILLVFRLNTDPGTDPQPVGSAWYISMQTPGGSVRGVRMAWKGASPGEPTFESYIARPNSAGGIDGRFVDPASLQPLEPSSSYDPANGIITLVVKASQLGLEAGEIITGFNSAVTQTSDPLVIGAGATFTIDEMPNGLAYTNNYVVTPNALCAPNLPPIAALAASYPAGADRRAPLTVNFDASGSSDPNTGDSVVSYTFNFGDGSPTVTQNNPTISHTYTDHGIYKASVVVRDSKHAVSTNPAEEIIQVKLPLLRIVSRLTHGKPGKFHGPKGPWNILLPIDGLSGVEPRRVGGQNGSGKYSIIYTFDRRIKPGGSGAATVSDPDATVNVVAGPKPKQVTVNLDGVKNHQRLVVTLNNVQDVAGAVLTDGRARMRLLLGDVNGDGKVKQNDVQAVDAQFGTDATQENFHKDVNANGIIRHADRDLTRSQLGKKLP